jgi:hypothetical protein
MQEEAAQLAGRLIAMGFLPREDPAVVRALTDQPFRDELDRRLAACGLVLLDNPYAAHVAVAMAREFAKGVFGRDDHWVSNTLGLSKPEITLLVVLWALLIIPKRERQLARVEQSGQTPLIADGVGIDREPREFVLERTLVEDFKYLWAPTYIRRCLAILARHKFISIEGGEIFEGPRLDLIMDYAKMAPRVKEGILADYRKVVEARRNEQTGTALPAEAEQAPEEDGHV